MKPVINIEGLGKSYQPGGVIALEDIDFSINRGELFGIIGPDGAGKTTLFRILTTLLLPDKGKATVLGLDVVDHFKIIRPLIGYMPGRFSLYQDLTVQENLEFFATVYNASLQENYHLISDIYEPLRPFKNRRAGKLSGGMKQKLALCCTLIHRPKVLFLDEPTTGVDAVSRKEFWEMLHRLREHGITILVSTPYMDEASQCDRIALMQKGRILSIDTPADLVRSYAGKLWAVRGRDMFSLLKDLRAFPGAQRCFSFGDYHHLAMLESFSDEASLRQHLASRGHPEAEIKRIMPTVEDCFMALMEG